MGGDRERRRGAEWEAMGAQAPSWAASILRMLLLGRGCVAWDAETKANMRENVRSMFHHGYDSYMRFAFPHDELKPLSRSYTDSLVELGNAQHPTRTNYSGVALTLIDALDTLAVLGNASEFAWGVEWVQEHVSFDLDIDVSVFETNIRLLGGLLSAHMIAAGETRGAEHLRIATYNGQLLSLAKDLGGRLMGAFSGGCTKLPAAFVNLRGRPTRRQTLEQCTAGVGTLLLEFGVLSRLTGESRFEEAALCALRLLWSKRSKLDLLGNTLDVSSGAWRNPAAGIGAGVDSFYEYALKSYLVFGRLELWEVWNTSYVAAIKHLRHGPWYAEINMHKGKQAGASPRFDSLQAFWPSLQVLVGDLQQAAETHGAFHSLWKRFDALPERYDVLKQESAGGAWAGRYPLRPELAESAYALYRATANSRYLAMGAQMVQSLNSFARTDGGFAALQEVAHKEGGAPTQEDHMPSFFLAETLKYLYLLFDEDNWMHRQGTAIVFTTEGHLIPLSARFSSPAALTSETHLDKLAVLPMRELIASAGLSSHDCIEKGQLKARTRDAIALLRQQQIAELDEPFDDLGRLPMCRRY